LLNSTASSTGACAGGESQETQIPKNATLIFIHIAKAGGSTLNKIARRQYRRGEFFSVYNWERQQELLRTMPSREVRSIRILFGHMEFGWHSLLPQKTVYSTMLREPVSRVISDYYYINQVKSNTLHAVVHGSGMSVEEYLRKRLNLDAANGQTFQLAGAWAARKDARLNDDHLLKVAKRNLDNYFRVFGIQERFDESLLAMKRFFGWGRVYYFKVNVTHLKGEVQTMPDRALRAIREYNELDIELYDYARRRFDDDIRRYGASFRRELSAFRLANRTYGRFIAPLLDRSLYSLEDFGVSGASSVIRAIRSM
jgi:Galactose-3-O-sulfotransferase